MDNILEKIQKDMKTPDFQFKAQETGEKLSLSVFNGKPNLTIFPPDKSGQRGVLARQAFPMAGWVMLRRMLVNYDKMNPGDRKALVFQTWDRDQKQNIPAGTMILGKDEKMQYYIEMQFKFEGNNKQIKFNISCGQGIQESTAEFGWPERSAAQMAAVAYWCTDVVPVLLCTTGRKMQFNGNGGGGNGGGGNSY